MVSDDNAKPGENEPIKFPGPFGDFDEVPGFHIIKQDALGSTVHTINPEFELPFKRLENMVVDGVCANPSCNVRIWGESDDLSTNEKFGRLFAHLLTNKKDLDFIGIKDKKIRHLQYLVTRPAQKQDGGKPEETQPADVEIPFGKVGSLWLETIRDTNEQGEQVPKLLICSIKQDFLPGAEQKIEWEIKSAYEHNGKRYVPVVLDSPELISMLPPAPVKFEKESEIDEIILRLKEKAVDLTKAEKLFAGDIWNGLIIPYLKHTWNFDDFNTTINLKFMADFGSGKTAALGFVGALCYRPIFAGGQSLAVILRFCDRYSPTLIWNELELAQSTDPDIIKLINNKFQAGFVFHRADQNDQKTTLSYRVYGPIVASSRRPYADGSTESRFIGIEMDENVKPIDLFFELRKQPEYDGLLGMLFYNRLKNKAVGITPDQDAVTKMPISRRSQQLYALLFPFVSPEKREDVKRILLQQEAEASVRRAESEEGQHFNAVLSILSAYDDSDEFMQRNLEGGAATSDLRRLLAKEYKKRIMVSLGFYEVRVREPDEQGKLRSRRKWFMRDVDRWRSATRKYVAFSFDSKGAKIFNTDLGDDFGPNFVPVRLIEQKFQTRLDDEESDEPKSVTALTDHISNGKIEKENKNETPPPPSPLQLSQLSNLSQEQQQAAQETKEIQQNGLLQHENLSQLSQEQQQAAQEPKSVTAVTDLTALGDTPTPPCAKKITKKQNGLLQHENLSQLSHIRFLKDAPAWVTDGLTYGPFSAGGLAELPVTEASWAIKSGLAEPAHDKESKPDEVVTDA